MAALDNLTQWIESLNRLYFEGEAPRIRSELKKLTRVKIPREHLLAISRLARQTDLTNWAVRLLNPIVRPQGKVPADASDEEKAEYAACLIKIGATEEALELLAPLDPRKIPQLLLYTAFARVTKWDYAETIPILNAYIQADLEPNQRIMGEVNLAAAHVFLGDAEEARRLLGELQEKAKERKLNRLLGNTLSLSAQVEIEDRKFEKASTYLEEAHKLLQASSGLDEFLVRKWGAILKLCRGDREGVRALHAIRSEAIERKHWESVRACDRYEAIVKKDMSLFRHVYLGTPFESFRWQMTRDFGETVSMPGTYCWEISGSKCRRWIDISTGETSRGHSTLKTGQTLHRLLVALSADFYAPLRLASLHYRLYPQQFFNPLSAPLRVHQVLNRIRQWFSAHRIPLIIDEMDGFYSFSAKSRCTLRISTHMELKETPQLKRVRNAWGERLFSTAELSELLTISPRSARRLVKDATEKNLIEVSGSGSHIKYRLRQS